MHAHRDGQSSRVSHRMALFRQRNTFEGLVERHTGSGATENKVSLLCGCILESEQSSGVWVIALICVHLMADCLEVKVIISESHQGGKGQQSRKYRARGWVQHFVCCFNCCVLFIFVCLPLTQLSSRVRN